MANHKAAIKRVRQIEARRVENKYHERTTRNAIKQLRNTSDKTEAEQLLPKVSAMLDKLAKRNNIHKSKAANLKSGLQKLVNSL